MDKYLIGALAVRDGLIKQQAPQFQENIEEEQVIPAETYRKLRNTIREIVSRQFRVEELDPTNARESAVIKNKFNNIALSVINSFKEMEIPEFHIPVLTRKLFSDVLGYGPLEPYLNDPEVTDITVNGTVIHIHKGGRKIRVKERFETPEQGLDLVRRMIMSTNGIIDTAHPYVSSRLYDGSRLMAHTKPAARDNFLLSIRRFRQDIDAETLIKSGAVSEEVMEFLKTAVKLRKNIIVSGGTSTGKTTWLNVLASFIDKELSIITVEDPAELQLQHPDVRRLEAVAPNQEGQGEYTLSQAIRDALRMRPDIIILGESRGEEAYWMLQAMNTGHPGSMGTVHANSARDTVIRLPIMVMQEKRAAQMPYYAVITYIASALDLIIYINRDENGRRYVDHIAEVTGVGQDSKGNPEVALNTLWKYDAETGKWKWTGREFHFSEEFAKGGWHIGSLG